MGDTPVLILFSPWLTLICQVVKFVKHNLRLRFPTLNLCVLTHRALEIFFHFTVKIIKNFMPHGVNWTGWIFVSCLFLELFGQIYKNWFHAPMLCMCLDPHFIFFHVSTILWVISYFWDCLSLLIPTWLPKWWNF